MKKKIKWWARDEGRLAGFRQATTLTTQVGIDWERRSASWKAESKEADDIGCLMLMFLWKGCRMTPRDGCREANQMLYPWESNCGRCSNSASNVIPTPVSISSGSVDRMLLDTPNCDGSFASCLRPSTREVHIWIGCSLCLAENAGATFMLCIPRYAFRSGITCIAR